MQCPNCSKNMQKGVVQLYDPNILNMSSIFWCPENEVDKLIKKNKVNLKMSANANKAVGYYCQSCQKVICTFKEKKGFFK